MELEGKCALITGGSRGIGAALVEKFVAAGCDEDLPIDRRKNKLRHWLSL